MEQVLQTDGRSDLGNTEIAKCVSTGALFVFWRPQLLKLDMVCRIPSDTLTPK